MKVALINRPASSLGSFQGFDSWQYPTVANSEGERGVAKLNQGVKKNNEIKITKSIDTKGFLLMCVIKTIILMTG